MHRIEPEQKSEPKPRRATPPGQLLQLITDQGPVPDQLIFIQHTRHEAARLSRKYGSHQPPQTQRIRINTGRGIRRQVPVFAKDPQPARRGRS